MTTPQPHLQMKLYNSLTRTKQAFTPLDPEHVRMYVCGITPYDFAHIGNLRTMVTFDVMYRLLRQIYGENKVTYVRNYTDIDDKIVERAQETAKQPFDLAAEFIEIFENDMAAMKVLDLPRDQKPRVSDYLKEIATMVDALIAQGFAYVTESGDVMFDVPAFEKLPNPPHDSFGYIARRSFENVQARVEEDAEKRDPRDFPVWKANAKSATKLEQAFVPAELGAQHFTAPGRPGWHIECSVMSESILGQHYKPGDSALFDIHGGGEDLAFPHHSCEIAQTEALHPTCTMCSVWMHGAFITVDGQKMSKSLSNFKLISEVLKQYSAEAIRLWMLQTHYRKPLDFSDDALKAAEKRWQRYQSEALSIDEDVALPVAFIEALGDDLNTPKAMAVIDESTPAERRAMLKFFGLEAAAVINEVSPEQLELLTARESARLARNWAESDRLRDVLKNEHGILVEDTSTGQTWRRI